MPRFETDLMLEADRAEQAGDLATATAALRRHLGSSPADMAARLRYARLLMACGERAAARHELEVLDRGNAAADAVAPDANRLLAELDESEGALARAALRWERLLAIDIDDPQARAHLRRLRADEIQPPAEGAAGTLVSPDGVEILRYRLVRELGRGGTSAVYLARDQVLDIPIALKVLHPQLAGPARSEARRRFFAEARLAAALRHPGVIAIYDLDEGARTLSMEYVAGGTLRARLRQVAAANPSGADHGAFEGAEILATARSLLEALAHVHARGIAHGDLKPSNLLLRQPGVVVIADFGIAQLIGGASGDVGTESTGDAPGGTPLYLAPEQFAGAPASPATDLFATGAIIWEMMMGRPLRDQRALLAGSLHDAAPVAPQAIERLGETGAVLAALAAALTRRLAAERVASASDALARLPSSCS
jgi:tRNA A-37 threonylcarbamoyl transferase component Bud32